MKVLHVAAEIFPLVKTGGLADVAAALPPALAKIGLDVRLLLPGLPAIRDAMTHLQPVIDLGAIFGAARVRVMRGTLPGSHLTAYVIDAPALFDRRGGPYQAPDGRDWGDNLQRFGLLGWVGARIGLGDIDLEWQPEIVHAHDWHAAMACAYLSTTNCLGAATVFTVHNLAYQGLFPLEDRALLGLSARFMSAAGLEFHGQLSFMKAGLKYANRVTTVSPTYAKEIATPEFGVGLDGVIRGRGAHVCGIRNGIDTDVWNPATDPAIEHRYDAGNMAGKAICKRALQLECGLEVDDDALLVTVVSRLTPQKGIDLVLAAIPNLVPLGVQFAIQGTGDTALEAALRVAEADYPEQVKALIGYDEARAHRLIAGADAIAVPSRFEPCGLTQMYGLRYGTLPIVRRVGGLADTVVDATPAAVVGRVATGFTFDAATPVAFEACVRRVAGSCREGSARRILVAQAMSANMSWETPARDYANLYGETLIRQTVPDWLR